MWTWCRIFVTGQNVSGRSCRRTIFLNPSRNLFIIFQFLNQQSAEYAITVLLLSVKALEKHNLNAKCSLNSDQDPYLSSPRPCVGALTSRGRASQLHFQFSFPPTHPHFLTVILLISPSLFITFKAIIFPTSFCFNTDPSFSLFSEVCDVILLSHHFSVLIYSRTT